MNHNREEMLPQIVEDRLQEAYERIRSGEIRRLRDEEEKQAGDEAAERTRTAAAKRQEGERKQMKNRADSDKAHTSRKKKSGRRKSWLSVAAVLALVIIIPSAVYAAVVYFQKTDRMEGDSLTYEFALNYELVPGEYQVKAGYLPAGFGADEDGDGKYYGEHEEWITIMPVYTTAELDKINNQITLHDIDKVEHTELSGMPADVITFKEAEKNRSHTHIFLFNEEEGYVLDVVAGYGLDQKELLKFADSLAVERTGDGSYETEEEKEARQQEAQKEVLFMEEGQKVWDELMRLGIPEEKMAPIGRELLNYDKTCGYTVTDYEFLDSIEGFAEENFFDFTRFDGWLNADGTLLPYTRQHMDKNGEVIGEEKIEQKFLRVDVKVHCYDDTDPDTALNLALQYVTKNEEGAFTWVEDYYEPVPSEEYYLQMDDSAVYFDKAVNVSGDERSHFFYRELKAGEDLEYTLLFVVDKDREDDFLLCIAGGNNDLWQTGSMTVEEIRDGLEGYIRLH